MAKPRKKWQLRYRGTSGTDTFPSQKKTYEFIRDLASSYAAGQITDPKVYVWIDEGDGRWQQYEDVMLSDPVYANPARS